MTYDMITHELLSIACVKNYTFHVYKELHMKQLGPILAK